jgi:hypothetical protein
MIVFSQIFMHAHCYFLSFFIHTKLQNSEYSTWNLFITKCFRKFFSVWGVENGFWPLARRSGPRNSFVVKTFFLPFAKILEYFIILWFRTSLDMFTYDFKKGWQEMIQLYQIASCCSFRTLKQDWTSLKNRIKSHQSF